MHWTLSGLFDPLISVRGITSALAAAGVLMGTYGYARARLSLSWPKTKGRIVASVVDVEYGKSGRTEEPLIAYQYNVEGITFARSSINGGMDMSWSTTLPGVSSAQETVDQYPIDREVDVYYWPQFPGVSCLRPGGGRAGALATLVFSLAVLAGALLIGR